MKSLIDLHLRVLEESGTQFGISTLRDVKTIKQRVEHEGLSFLTITLPTFATDLQRALADGRVDSNHFTGFPRAGGVLPLFMKGWTSLVFNEETGVLLREADIEAIRVLLQVTGMMKKVELECTEKRTQAAFASYAEIENQIRKMDQTIDASLLVELRVWSHLLFGDLLHTWENQVKRGSIIPNHGPGKVADKLSGNAKWNQSSWHERLEDVFPFGRYAFSSWSLYLDDLDSGGRASRPGKETPVKVVAVPKTLKTPRIIAIEPAAMQYMQQGLKRAFEEAVRTSKYGHLVNYESQLPNQEMARRGSLEPADYSAYSPDEVLATLDLSEASDRVSNQLVRAVLSDFPLLMEAVDATRSRSADVPGHGVIRLAKFASMGSALCFPVESLIFATIVMMAGWLRQPEEFRGSSTQQSRKAVIRRLDGKVRVYGDDIICPSSHALSVVQTLEAFGLKVNKSKSFWNGNFRESCGKEYFRGHDVTHVKVRGLLPTQQMSETERATSLVKTSALRNHLFEYGYWRTCQWLDELMEGFMPYPAVGPDSPAIGRLSSLGYQVERWDFDLQIPLVKAFVVNVKSPVSPLDDSGALMKCLTTGLNPDPEHLLRAGRPSSLRIKKRWVRAY